MNSTACAAPVDPSTRFALAVLRRHLADEGDFSTAAVGDIITHVRTEGTVDGAPFVRPDEVDRLTEVFIRAFPAVPYDDPAWGAPLPAVAGGCDDIPPEYHPTPEDWAAYNAMMATADYLDGFNAVRPDDA